MLSPRYYLCAKLIYPSQHFCSRKNNTGNHEDIEIYLIWHIKTLQIFDALMYLLYPSKYFVTIKK